MLLNLDIIQGYLPKEYQTKRYGAPNRECTCPRPLLYESNQVLLEGNLYVAQADMLPKVTPPKNCAFIVVGTRVPREWLLGDVELLAVSNCDNILSVFNAVHLLYNSFDQWDAQLRDELEKDLDFDIRRVLYLGSQKLGRNISVVNHSLQGILNSEIKSGTNGSMEILITDTLQPMSIEYSERIKEVCNLERVITVPYLSSIEDRVYRYYCYNLYRMGNFTGCISIGEETGAFQEGDFPLMDHFFRCFEKAFWNYLRNCAQAESAEISALKKILNHTPLSAEEQLLLSLQPGDSWCCFRLKERRKGNSFPKDYMYATISTIIPKLVYAVIHHGEIIGLLRVQQESREEILTFFGQILKQVGYYGGISNLFTDLASLNYYLSQASYAVEQGGETDVPLHYFQDHVLNYMLSACIGEMPVESYLSEGLNALREHDNRKGSEYLKTLDIYLRNEMSITQTSKELFIHRSSLLKRLDKIQRLLKDDLTDPDIRLYYRICLAMSKLKP